MWGCLVGSNNNGRPRVLIEETFPIDLLNQQVLKETRGSPFTAVHRWFSRKPLSFSRASVLASLLPADTTADDFVRLLGMPKVASKDFRLYQQTPSPAIINEVHERCRRIWGDSYQLIDAFAGGGSIPFESIRYGIATIASDLNPVAVATMKAAIEVPLTLGTEFESDLVYWVSWVGEQVKTKLLEYFPSAPGERVRDYLWAHTVHCPECNLCVPLSPSWWVDSSQSSRTSARACAVRLIVPESPDNQCSFEIAQGVVKDNKIDGYSPDDAGTLARATGRCPRCTRVLPTDYLMAQAQTSGFGYQLYAVAYHNARGTLCFRVPTEQDLNAVIQAKIALQEATTMSLMIEDAIPSEEIPQDTQRGPDLNLYGLYDWKDLYTSRQLLSLATMLTTVRSAIELYGEKATPEQKTAMAVWLTMVLDRCVDMNCRLGRWKSSTVQVINALSTHSLNLMWNFPEINGASRLWQLCAEAATDDYDKLCRMAQGTRSELRASDPSSIITITVSDAADLAHISDASIVAAVTDPPYLGSIRYAEISDMYYVWEKRVLKPFLPDVFAEDLSNKELEAITNPGRFRGLPNAANLANQDYEIKLNRAFQEYHRVLRDDGVLTVQFNHKESGAWDMLSQGLISAGFEITATWAVNTESPDSIHQAEKNAVASTVLLVCRKRIDTTSAWWEDVQPQVRQAVMDRVPELERMGIKGIDLYLASFGPALQILSRNWPVRDRTNTEVRPEMALKEARNAVVDQRMAMMTEGHHLQLDPVSRFYLIAWDCFLAREFSFDEARLLTLSTGDVSISDLRDKYRILAKKGNDVSFLTPRERVRLGEVNIQSQTYARLVDALHAALALYVDEGIVAVQRFFQRTNLFDNPDFVQFVELALKMLPQASDEHKTLTDLLLSDVKLRGAIQMPLFDEIEAQTHEQPRLF